MVKSHWPAGSRLDCPDAAVETKIGYFWRKVIGRARRSFHEKDVFRSNVFVDARGGRSNVSTSLQLGAFGMMGSWGIYRAHLPSDEFVVIV